VSDRITRGCNAIFGHVARLPDNIPAHQAMLRQVELSVGRPTDPTWKRPPGRPRTKWTDQLRHDNNNVPIATLWRQAIAVAVTRERRYGPSRLRVNDDDVAMLCTAGLRMTSCTTNRRREKAYTQSDSTWGSADLTPRRILRLTHQGQHRSGAKSDVYDCLFGVVCSRTATERGREVAVCRRTLFFDRCRRRPTTTTTTTTTTVGILRQVTETGHARRRTPLVVVCIQMSVRHCGGPRRHNLSCLFSFVRLCDISRLRIPLTGGVV